MEKKKLKLSISGTSKKTFSSIEQAKSKSKNTVVIEKKNSKYQGKSLSPRPAQNNNNFATNKSIPIQEIKKPTISISLFMMKTNTELVIFFKSILMNQILYFVSSNFYC